MDKIHIDENSYLLIDCINDFTICRCMSIIGFSDNENVKEEVKCTVTDSSINVNYCDIEYIANIGDCIVKDNRGEIHIMPHDTFFRMYETCE